MVSKDFLLVLGLVAFAAAQVTEYPVLALWSTQQGSRVGSFDPFDGTYYFNHSQLMPGYSPKPACFYNPTTDLFHMVQQINGVSLLMTSFLDGSGVQEYPVNLTEQIHTIELDTSTNTNYAVVIYPSQQLALYTYTLIGGAVYWNRVVLIPNTYRAVSPLSTYCPKGHIYFLVVLDNASNPWLLRINVITGQITPTQIPFLPSSIDWDWTTATLYTIGSYVDPVKGDIVGVFTVDVDSGKLLSNVVTFPGGPYPTQVSCIDTVSHSLYTYTVSSSGNQFVSAIIYLATGNSDYEVIVNQSGDPNNPYVPRCMALLGSEIPRN